jgi:hypothetical protein
LLSAGCINVRINGCEGEPTRSIALLFDDEELQELVNDVPDTVLAHPLPVPVPGMAGSA